MGTYNVCKAEIECPFCHESFVEYIQYKWGLLAIIVYSVGDRIVWDPEELEQMSEDKNPRTMIQSNIVRGTPIPWLMYFSSGEHRSCPTRAPAIKRRYLEDIFPVLVEIKDQKINAAYASLTNSQAEIFLEQILRRNLVVYLISDFSPPVEIQIARLAMLSECLARLCMRRVNSDDETSLMFLRALGYLAWCWAWGPHGEIGSSTATEDIVRYLCECSRGAHDRRRETAESSLAEIRKIDPQIRNKRIWPKIEKFL